ncbi:MAG: flagellin [Bryobacteraceae bacterium]|jgi:flagellar hook-associated protein 3 FlgL
MITNLDPESALFLADVNRIQQRLADANSQVSSGKKINVASDAPDQIDSLLQLRADQQSNTQIESNLTLAQADANGADNALSAAIHLMDRAVTLATRGATATSDATTQANLAQEVQSLQEQMVSYSQTRVQGRYIFSGDLDGSPSYALDLTAPNGVDQLSNSASTRQIENPAGGSFPASKTAQEIFDDQNPDGTPAADNVFAALNALRTALLNNDSNAIGSSIGALEQASDHLNSMEAFYGTVENRIQDATSFASQYDTQLQTEISQKQDADVTAAALGLTQANTQLQAAYQARAKMPHTSLFDFLV